MIAGEPAKIAFDRSGSKDYLGTQTVYVDSEDRYGNVIGFGGGTPDTLTGHGAGMVITTNGDGGKDVALTKLGRATLTATFGGFSATRNFAVVKDTPTISKIASTLPPTGTLDITVEAAHSNADLVGTLTLHYGKHTLKSALVTTQEGSLAINTASFDLSTLARGKYVLYATYSGSGAYNAVSTKKVTVRVS